MRSLTASGANPPNTTLCGAPIRAHASIATTTSGIIGRKIPTTSPLPTPMLLERVREPLHVEVELGVGDRPLFALLAGPVEGDAVAVAGLDVAVQAVIGHVQLAVAEPLIEGRVRVIEHGGERLVPVQGPRLLGPERVRVERGLLVERARQ